MIMQDLTRRTMLVSAAAAMWCWPRPERSALAGSRVVVSNASGTRRQRVTIFCQQLYRSRSRTRLCALSVHLCEDRWRIGVRWYAGSREGGRDVAVWMAESAALNITQSTSGNRGGEHPVWGAPQRIVDRQTAMRDLDRYVDKVGNSVLFAMPDGQLWLVYVTIAAGGGRGVR